VAGSGLKGFLGPRSEFRELVPGRARHGIGRGRAGQKPERDQDRKPWTVVNTRDPVNDQSDQRSDRPDAQGT